MDSVVLQVGGRLMEPVAVVWVEAGVLRLYRVCATGRLYAEVSGVRDVRSREALGEVAGQLEDLVAEVLVADDPGAYGVPDDEVTLLTARENHCRVGA